MTLKVEVVAAVEVAVGDGFHDVVALDAGALLEVGDGAGDFQDAVVGAGLMWRWSMASFNFSSHYSIMCSSFRY